MDANDWAAMAAWVQAVGSILAICAAIWIGWRSDARAMALVESERFRQARIAASSVALKLENIAVEAAAKRDALVLAKDKATNTPDANIQLEHEADFVKLFMITQSVAAFRPWTLVFDSESGVLAGTAFDIIEGSNNSFDLAVDTYLKFDRSKDGLVRLFDQAIERYKDLIEIANDVAEHLTEAHEL